MLAGLEAKVDVSRVTTAIGRPLLVPVFVLSHPQGTPEQSDVKLGFGAIFAASADGMKQSAVASRAAVDVTNFTMTSLLPRAPRFNPFALSVRSYSIVGGGVPFAAERRFRDPRVVAAHSEGLPDCAEATASRPGHRAAHILDVAERLVQTRGFNGFGYADIAAELRITKARHHA